MKTSLFVAAMVLITAGCGPSQAEYDSLAAELEALRDSLSVYQAHVAELEDLPANRLARARELEGQNRESEAEEAFRELIARYPDSQEAGVAADAIASIEQQREQARLEKERRRQEEECKKRLGFKVLRAATKVEVGDITFRVSSVQVRRQWVFDRYERRYHYRDAVRGSKYVVVDVRITSKEHNPVLPPIYAYRVVGDRLHHVGRLRYEFYRWDDYGSYLGNYADYGNDFAHTETIRFSAGLQVTDAISLEPLFILVQKQGCFSRSYDRLDNPPTSYSGTSCQAQSPLTLEAVDQGGFQAIKIFNASKL